MSVCPRPILTVRAARAAQQRRALSDNDRACCGFSVFSFVGRTASVL